MDSLSSLFPILKSFSNGDKIQSVPDSLAYMSGWKNASETVRLGKTQTGHLDWDTGNYPNLILMGNAGSGKSVLHRAIFYHCLTHNNDWVFYGVDPFRLDTAPHRKYERTFGGTASDVESSLKLLEGIDLQIQERYQLWSQEHQQEKFDLEKHSMKSIMLVIDTFYPITKDVFDWVKSHHSDYARIVKIRELFARIVEHGSKVGVHVVWTAMAGPVPQLDSQFIEYFDAVITTSRIDYESSEQFFGSDRAAIISEYGMNGFVRGKGLAKFGDLVEEFRGYLIDDESVQAWVKEHGQHAEPQLWAELNSK